MRLPGAGEFRCSEPTGQGAGIFADLFACGTANGNHYNLPGSAYAYSDVCGCVDWLTQGIPVATGETCMGVNPVWIEHVMPTLKWLKEGCPSAYTYPYDDKTSTYRCASASSYTVTFCPNGRTLSIAGVDRQGNGPADDNEDENAAQDETAAQDENAARNPLSRFDNLDPAPACCNTEEGCDDALTGNICCDNQLTDRGLSSYQWGYDDDCAPGMGTLGCGAAGVTYCRFCGGDGTPACEDLRFENGMEIETAAPMAAPTTAAPTSSPTAAPTATDDFMEATAFLLRGI
jgi:hypothetical protein